MAELRASRLVHEPDELGKAWLARELADSEVIVCWLRAADSVTLESQIVGQTQARPYLFVSDRRARLSASRGLESADLTYTPLHTDSLRMRAQGEQTELSGAGLFLSRKSDAQAARDAFELIALPARLKARLLEELLRRLWLTREQAKEESAQSLSLLQAAIALRAVQRGRLTTAAWRSPDDAGAGTQCIDPARLARALSDSSEGHAGPAGRAVGELEILGAGR